MHVESCILNIHYSIADWDLFHITLPACFYLQTPIKLLSNGINQPHLHKNMAFILYSEAPQRTAAARPNLDPALRSTRP